MENLASLLNLVEKKMNNCPKCGWDLSEKVGAQGESHLNAIERARERLKKEMGFGIPERTYKHIKDILKDLPYIKASEDFEEKLERKIKDYETKISKGKGKSITKPSKR